jgi:hypothetical protein
MRDDNPNAPVPAIANALREALGLAPDAALEYAWEIVKNVRGWGGDR